jgi:hypothetical protein
MDDSGSASRSQIPRNPFVTGKCWYYNGDLSDHTYPNHLPGEGRTTGVQNDDDGAVIFIAGISANSNGELKKYDRSL